MYNNLHSKRFLRLFAFMLMSAAIFLMPQSTVIASEKRGDDFGTIGNSDKIDHYSRATSFFNIKHTTSLSDIDFCANDPDITCQNFVAGSVNAKAECTGGYGASGGWQALNVTGSCWNNLDVCYGSTCKPVVSNVSNANIDFQPYTKCTGSSKTSKQNCNFNYSGVSGVTHNTGDDMFKIEDVAETFFEYARVGDVGSRNRLVWIDRNAPGEDPIMMPSGPSASYDDYHQFVRQSSGGVDVQGGCYPTEVGVCSGTTVALPSFDGMCGVAHSKPAGTYLSLASIPAADFCDAGTPVQTSENAAQISWRCPGYNGGAMSGQCTAIKSTDGVCGSDNGKEFADLAALQASGKLCAAGTPTAITGTGPFYWTCKATSGATGKDASCAAFKELDACDSFFENDNMVFVQDVSGSFSDDINNIVTELEILFNNPIFAEWHVGITRFNSSMGGHYTKVQNFKRVKDDKNIIINNTRSHRNHIAGSENAWHGTVRAIQDFDTNVPDDEEMTIVLVTDEWEHGYTGGSFNQSQARDAINASNSRLVALTTANIKGQFTGFANSVKSGKQVTITSNSSNFQQALLEGLIEVNCEP